MTPVFEEAEAVGTSQFDPMRLLRLFQRRWRRFVIPFLFCFTMALLVVNVQTPVYFSSSQFLVIHNNPTASSLPRETSRYGSRNFDRDLLITFQTIASGPDFLHDVARQYYGGELGSVPAEGLAATATELPDTVDLSRINRLANNLRRQIRVAQDAPRMFNIGVRSDDPERAYDLARVVLSRFLEAERASRLQPGTATLNFLLSQREVRQRELTAAERRLAEFQRSLMSPSLGGNPINETNLTRAENLVSRMQTQFYSADTVALFELERGARSVLGNLPRVDAFLQDPAVVAAARELEDLEYGQVLGQINSSGDAVAQDRLGGARLNLNQAVETRTARNFPQLGVMERSKVSQYYYQGIYHEVRQRVIKRLDDMVQECRGSIRRGPDQSATLTRLQQEADRARTALSTIEQDISQENLRREADLSEVGYKIVVRQNPVVPGAPIEPNKVKLAFAGFILALAVGMGLVIGAELLDRTLKSVDEIEAALGVAVIGTLPAINSEYFRGRQGRRLGGWTLVVLALLVVVVIALLVFFPRIVPGVG
jgi:uncharacterized protein involved in exopolysaccharide biosynthesis